jgi:hypothetical protein
VDGREEAEEYDDGNVDMDVSMGELDSPLKSNMSPRIALACRTK